MFGVATTGPATAHTSLAAATPAIGGEVDVVTEIVLEYEGPLAEDETHAIRLLAPDEDTVIAEGDAELRSDRIIALAVDAELPGNGQYLVDWAIVAGDGDDQASRYAFTYTGASEPFQAEEQVDASAESQSQWSDVPYGVFVLGSAVVGLLLVLAGRRAVRSYVDNQPSEPPESRTR
ncbi:copper resistance CopC family protein [Euzebya tangerina]|uniref:copper resistance CopC family protein n=1 Tax=Euzebya tangerina TaxID=591198 RepID=UPI0013C2A300|nr:copper resistance protein CopC [Euzebya tangerina]